MFRGSLPSSATAIIHAIAKEWPCAAVYVGCAGNFTVERAALHGLPFETQSNDVTLCSCVIGA